MSAPPSRYRPDAPPDYGHRFHAGNVGDVWKHCALVAVLAAVAEAARRVGYLDTHAGEGRYRLGPTGEWSEGIGRLWSTPAAGGAGDVVDRYLALCRERAPAAGRPAEYPGSPAFARAVLGPDATLRLWERDEATAARLAAHVGDDPHARLTRGEGLAGLRGEIGAAESAADAVVVLVDPPWTQKADWTAVPDAVARAVAGRQRTCVVLWYPVKSLTRPNAMVARVQAAGVSGTLAELVTTPLGTRRHRLNGSGVLLVGPPAGALEALAAAAPRLGRACATQAGTWSFRLSSWTGAA